MLYAVYKRVYKHTPYIIIPSMYGHWIFLPRSTLPKNPSVIPNLKCSVIIWMENSVYKRYSMIRLERRMLKRMLKHAMDTYIHTMLSHAGTPMRWLKTWVETLCRLTYRFRARNLGQMNGRLWINDSSGGQLFILYFIDSTLLSCCYGYSCVSIHVTFS